MINGVFKGGGAKGIAYAGALNAVAKRNMWFGSVAGTSAGAITASLIAAGYTPEEMTGLVDDLLATINKRLGRLLLGAGDAIYDGTKLQKRLDELFCESVGRAPTASSPVTFAELFAATGISLYVVALDLCRSHPVVFSVYTTPEVSVSTAVMASSAIPAAFPSIRAIFASSDQVWAQRLVDGGAWANFPRFVYHDPSFSRWIEQHCEVDLAAQRNRPTIGFAIGVDEPDEPLRPDKLTLKRSGSAEYDRGVLQDSLNPWLWAAGALLSGATTRLVLLVGWLLLSVVVWTYFPANLRSTLEGSTLGPLGPVTPSFGAIYVLTVSLGLAI